MKHIILAGIISLTLSSQGWAGGEDFQKGLNALGQGDFNGAAQIFTPLAEQGNADAQYMLGVMHSRGDGIEQDHVKAAKWISLAAEQSHPIALLLMGRIYSTGKGVPKDQILAYMWWTIADTQGYGHAKQNLAGIEKIMSAEDIKKANELAIAWMKQHKK